jgi:rhamnosyltransferase
MADLRSNGARIGAVIVTYQPDLRVVEQVIGVLLPQVEAIYVVDNGSTDETARRLQLLLAAPNCELVLLGRNYGIATAQNKGIARALSTKLDYLLLLDHDSMPASDLAPRLLHALQQLRAEGRRVAAAGAMWVDERSGRRGQFYRVRRGRIIGIPCADESAPVQVDFLIASGCMLSMAAVRDIGAMRDDLFIDHVDTEWCLRARVSGWQLFGVPAARLAHSLGDSGRRIWFGRWRDVGVHSPDRNYYEVRNTLLLLRTDGISANWAIALFTRLAAIVVFYALAVAPRWARVRRMARGLRDGALGRSGPLS